MDAKTMYTRVITNAGSLQVGDIVFDHKERIAEIYKQTESECFCQLQWTGKDQHGSVRYHAINTVNALALVTGGPTLEAANDAGDLPTTPTGQPIWKRVEDESERDLREWTEYMAAKAPRIEVRFIHISPFEEESPFSEQSDIERSNAQQAEFVKLLNDGWKVACEAFDIKTFQFIARLEREVRK